MTHIFHHNKPSSIAITIGVFCIALLNLAMPASAQPAQNETIVDGVAAVVGKNIVRFSDVERAYASIRLRQGASEAQKNRCAILENQIVNQLLIHKAELDSIEVTDDEISGMVDDYLKNDLRQYGSREALAEATGFAYDELKEQYERLVRNMYLAYRAQYYITEDVRITPREVTEFYNSIPTDSLPLVSEKYEISEIVIKPTISEAERDRIRMRLAELRERVLNGEKFAMLATLYSQDPGSAAKGGELGFFSRGEMVSEFESAAFALKPGEVSPVIETQYGFHIIQLIERRGNTINARHILLQPQVSAEDLLRTRVKLDSIADEIRAGKITFEQAARLYSGGSSASQGGSVTSPTDGTPRLDKAAIDKNYYAFGIPGLAEGQVTSAIATKTAEGKDSYAIVKLNKRYPEHKLSLSEDYDAVFDAALNAAKNRRLSEWAKRQSKVSYVKVSPQYSDCNFENILK